MPIPEPITVDRGTKFSGWPGLVHMLTLGTGAESSPPTTAGTETWKSGFQKENWGF